jgi:hypothetical protein
VNFNTVEASTLGVFSCVAEIFHHGFYFLSRQRTGGRDFLHAIGRKGFHIAGLNGRWSYWQFTILKERVRNSTYVPQLNENAPASSVHCVSDLFPALYLVFGMNARRINIAYPRLRNL